MKKKNTERIVSKGLLAETEKSKLKKKPVTSRGKPVRNSKENFWKKVAK